MSFRKPARASALLPQLKKEQNPLKRKMLLLGYITDRLEKRGKSIYLVGGQAVETYTAGQFTTGDIDITTTDREATEAILEQMGFKKESMIWLSEPLGIAVHIVGDAPRKTEMTRSVEVGPYTVRIVGVEDLIVDRLAAAKFWRSQRDMEQAKVLLESHKDQINSEYLRRRAREENVEDVLPA